MKPVRFLTMLTVLLGMVSMVFAVTPANTSITNQAFGTYDDANGNVVAGTGTEVSSNIVTTTVAQVYGVDVDPASDGLTVEPQSVALYGVTVNNTGNGSDTYDLDAVVSGTYSGTYTLELWFDADSNGAIGGSDTKLTDAGGYSWTTPSLFMTQNYHVIVRVENTDLAPDGDAPVVTLTATSQNDGSATADGVYTTTINSASVTVSMSTDNPNPQPGETITYTVCIDNGVGAATAYNVVFTNLIPANTTYVTGSILNADTTITDGFNDDDGDFGGTAASTVTVFVGDIAAGEQVCVKFTVLVDDDVPVGTVIDNDPVIDYENEGGDPYDPVEPPDGGGNGDETIAQLYDVSLSTSDGLTYTGDPGDVISFEFTVQNDGNGPDSFELTDLFTGDIADMVWLYYIDADSNGVIEGSELTTPITNTGYIQPFGANDDRLILAVGTIPAGETDEDASDVTFEATSDGDATASDPDLTITVTVTAPILKLFKYVEDADDALSGAADYADSTATLTEPGQTLTYTIVVQNWGTGEATDITITDDFSAEPVTYVASSATAGGVESSGVITWTIASISGGDSVGNEVTLTFQVTVD